jgi:hypothetical protein
MRLGSVVILTLVLSGCGDPGSGGVNLRPDSELPVGHYNDLAWVDDDRLVVALDPTAKAAVPQLAEFARDGEQLADLNLPSDSHCQRTNFLFPSRLPDGRLGLIKHCIRPIESNPNSMWTQEAYEFETGKLVTLTRFGPLTRRLNSGETDEYYAHASTATWNSSMKQGLIGTGGLCSTIARIDRHGIKELNALVESDGRSWNLRDQLFADPSETCSSKGIASDPQWSVRDDVAFFASPQAIGTSGPARGFVPSNLYLMKVGEWQPEVIVKDLVLSSTSSIEWSPDGRYLAFTAGMNGSEWGLWLFDSRTEELAQLSSERGSQLAWNPEGTELALLVEESVPDQGELAQTRIYYADLREAIEALA